MNKEQLHQLIDKYLRGEATIAERDTLLQWYRSRQQGDVEWTSDQMDEELLVKERMRGNIWTAIEEEPQTTHGRIGRSTYLVGMTAAAVLLIIGYFLWDGGSRQTDMEVVAVIQQQPEENRFVLLSDSSRIVLRPGSTLRYRNDFTGSTREVELDGEAYFDIASRKDQPFIIHTGEVKTTVLGTKFTIRTDRASKTGISVSVKEGKVKVENTTKVIAELLANQEVQYDKEDNNVVPRQMDADTDVFAWTAQDMRFDGVSFGELIERLERRYGVTIGFEKSSLKECLVSGRFDGTETLDTVLDILCATRNASYIAVHPDKILIKGDGC